MKIRIMQPDDYEKAMGLWNASVGVGISPDDSKENIKKYLLRNPLTSFVAVENNEVIGAIMAGHDGYRGFIHHTAVAEKYRHCGIGAELVKNALNAIKSEGINKVVMVVFKTNETGNLFWEKQGFTVREDLYYRNLRVSEGETEDDYIKQYNKGCVK